MYLDRWLTLSAWIFIHNLQRIYKKQPKKGYVMNESDMEDEESDTEDSKLSTRNFSVCRIVLNELEQHEDGWPFLEPVNAKDVSIKME